MIHEIGKTNVQNDLFKNLKFCIFCIFEILLRYVCVLPKSITKLLSRIYENLAFAKRLLLILFYPNLTIYIIVTSGPLNTNSKKKKKYEKILFCEFKMRLIPMGIIYAACPLHRCI